eukprot:11757407-Heterocapsa_arctica.AAC.1
MYARSSALRVSGSDGNTFLSLLRRDDRGGGQGDDWRGQPCGPHDRRAVSYTHLRAPETRSNL